MKTHTSDIKHSAYTAVCSKILDMAVDNYKKKEEKELCKVCGERPRMYHRTICSECHNTMRRKTSRRNPRPVLPAKQRCARCGKAPKRLGSRFCDACYRATQHENYEKRKERRAATDTQELCRVCGKAPKLASRSLCRDCLNAYRRKLHKERTGITTPKKYRGLCIVCGKNPKLPNMGKCRDCYNAHRRMVYAQLKKAADAAKAGQESVQVQVVDPVRVEVNNVGCGYVAAILFVLWIITVIGLVFR